MPLLALCASLAVLVLAAGCTVDELDLENRACPCLDGWVCDDSRNICVQGDAGGGGGDAGPSPDAGPSTDAGPEMDAGSAVDAGPAIDSGPGMDSSPGVDSGPSNSSCYDVHAGALFCDGFEDDDGFGAWGGQRIPAGSAVERITDVVYRGDAALHAVGVMGSNHASVWADVFLAAPLTDAWYRAYYYFPASAALGVEVHEMTSAMGGYNLIMSARNGTESDVHTHGWAGDQRRIFPRPVPRDTWLCVELHVHFGATDGAIELYWDGEEVAALAGIDTTPPRGLERIHAGLAWKEVDATTREVYVDEVVADTSRIGCD